MHSSDFHAHHSPLGAYASFTCGRHGAGGGLTIAGRAPAQHPLTVGWMAGGTLHELPFSAGADGVSLDNYAEEVGGVSDQGQRHILDGSQRRYAAGSDSWTAGNFLFTIYTPVWPLPDPQLEGEALLLQRLLPAVVCELDYDNRHGKEDVDLVFALRPGDPVNTLLPAVAEAPAVTWQRQFALATMADSGAESWVHWDVHEYLREHRIHRLGGLAGASRRIAAGTQGKLRLILAFHNEAPVTTGIDAKPWFTRGYPTLQSVLAAATQAYDSIVARCQTMDQELEQSGLDPHQQFLVAHAQRSYWGNTHLLDHGGQPLWVVYEGEYAMINTFDLAVDQCFYEMRRNPWVVRNILDQFVQRYAYHDTLCRPPADAAQRAQRLTMCRDPHRLHELVPEPLQRGLPGGMSFAHDMGVYPHFMPPGESSYEISGLAGCFSYMTCEQLYNWICTAVTYVQGSDDDAWLRRNAGVFNACLRSLINRDDPVPTQRNGLNSLDSEACAGGWEITTYDSLDHSLGQARHNGYMAVKGWAACIGLEAMFRRLGELKLAVDALDQAQRVAAAVVARFDTQRQCLPAVFEGDHDSVIIPAVEGLVFPLQWGMSQALAEDGPYADLIRVLGLHLRSVLQPGMCLFDDGAWKLSSSADNSWCSKIFLCQHVAERVYGMVPDSASHAAHARWQQIGSADWGMTDQCTAGIGRGSRYYPRCVTNDLWLQSRDSI